MIGATLQQGTVTASLRLRKLGSYLHHNGMAMALRELGSIERTLFILDWLQSIELRRRIQARLNKDEARNEHQYRPAVIEMAAGDTTVGFTPCSDGSTHPWHPATPTGFRARRRTGSNDGACSLLLLENEGS
jgi:hypothetical protein